MNTQNPTVKLSQSRLKELLDYDPETGIFTWRITRGRYARTGGMAGSPNGRGYLRITIDRRKFFAHRLAFLYMIGSFPPADADHINGVRDDNRWDNLREATRTDNVRNLGGARSDNTFGFLGVSWDKNKLKWQARIVVVKKHIHLGYYSSGEEAHAAYLKAKDELHPTHRRLRCVA